MDDALGQCAMPHSDLAQCDQADIEQFILSRMGWDYPPNSIMGTIFLVPIEEHLFFILQPIFLILLHCLISHSQLLPFHVTSLAVRPRIPVDRDIKSETGRKEQDGSNQVVSERTIQTLPRRPLALSFWAGVFLLGAILVVEAHGVVPGSVPRSGLGEKAFYLGWILVWISPVIGFLTWLGSMMGRDGWKAWALGSAWLCVVDT